MSAPQAVRIMDTRPDKIGTLERYVMMDGRVFWVDRHGWVFDHAAQPVPHPEVDEIMAAIRRWEVSR